MENLIYLLCILNGILLFAVAITYLNTQTTLQTMDGFKGALTDLKVLLKNLDNYNFKTDKQLAERIEDANEALVGVNSVLDMLAQILVVKETEESTDLHGDISNLVDETGKVDTSGQCDHVLTKAGDYFKENLVDHKKTEPETVEVKKEVTVEPVKKKGCIQKARPFTKKEYDHVLNKYAEFYEKKTAGEKGYSLAALAKVLNKDLDRGHDVKMYRKIWEGDIDREELED